MNYEPEFCDGELEPYKGGSYRTDQYSEDDFREDEVQANYLTDAKMGLI
jgi:hypothetical protein